MVVDEDHGCLLDVTFVGPGVECEPEEQAVQVRLNGASQDPVRGGLILSQARMDQPGSHRVQLTELRHALIRPPSSRRLPSTDRCRNYCCAVTAEAAFLIRETTAAGWDT
jgi:hypothetical protein